MATMTSTQSVTTRVDAGAPVPNTQVLRASAQQASSTLLSTGSSGGDEGSNLSIEQKAHSSLWLVCARLPVGLSVALPVRNFRVLNLLSMESGVVVETQWAQGEDLPLTSGAVQLAWTEFEVVDTRLAVRVTRLA
jgi:hypothetical protein